MRPARALCPSRLAGLMFLALTTATIRNDQGNLICQQPKTKVCRSWFVYSVEGQHSNNVGSIPSPLTLESCGFSKIHPFPSDQKFFEVSPLNKNKPLKTLHCQRIIIFGPFVDWVKINYALGSALRIRRQTFTPKGRYRGQTQSQYLAIDRGTGKDEGKAEAHSAADSSRASVSGNSGMGQAQSQTVYDPNCEDCYPNGKSQVEVENLKHPGSRPVGNGYGQNTGTNWPGVNHGQGNNVGYNPIDTQGKEPSPSSVSKRPGFYGPESQTDGYGGKGLNDNIGYRPPGTYGKPTSNNGNMFANNRPIDSGTNGYEPNNRGGYDMKNDPGNNYKNPGNVGSGIYRPIGSGTNSYQPFGNGVYDPVGNITPNTNGEGNIYTSGYPNRDAGLTPGGGIYRPSDANSNRFGPGVPSQGLGQGLQPGQTVGQYVGPGQGAEPGLSPGHGVGQGLGPGVGPGQIIRPGQGLGQGIGPGQRTGQEIGPGQGTGQGIGPGQGIGQGIVPGQRTGQGIGPGQGTGQGIGPGQVIGQGIGPGQGTGQGIGPGQGIGQGIGPGQGIGQGIGPGQRTGQGIGPGPSIGQGIGPGQGTGQGIGPGQGTGQGIGPGQSIGQGIGPDQGTRQGIGPGQGIGQGIGSDPGIGQGQGSRGSGLGGIPGQLLGPGQGQGIGTGQGQGVGLAQGQGVGPGSGHGLGAQQGTSQTIPGQNGAGDRQNGSPSTVGVYGPYQTGLGTRHEPNQNNLGREYRPLQNGLGSGVFNRGTNYPLASGPYAGPGGNNYYCCFVPNTGTTGNVYPNNYGVPNAINGQSNLPSGQLGRGVNGPNGATNQYGPSNDPSITQLPVSQYGTNSGGIFPPSGPLGTVISNGPTAGVSYRPDGSTFTQPSPYGTGFDTTSPLRPGSQLATGISSGPNMGGQYNSGLGTGILPSNYGTEIDSTRPLSPGGHLGTGVPNDPNIGSRYGPDVGQSNLPSGQIDFGSGPSMNGGQYSTNVGNVPQQQYGTFNPNKQNGGRGDGNGIYNGQPLPGDQYNNVINRGHSPGQYGSGNIPGNIAPGNQYNIGIDGAPVGGASTTPLRQYGTGTVSSQNGPGTQVGPGAYMGQQGTGGQFGPSDNSGLTSPRQQPLPGDQYNNVINRGNSPGQYGSGNVPGNNAPGNQYNTGIDGAPVGGESTTPLRQYGTGTVSSQNGPGTQVGPGAYMGQQGTGGQFGPSDNSGLTSPRQQYGSGPDILGTYPAGRPINGADQNRPIGTDTAIYPGSSYGTRPLDGPTKSYGLGTTGHKSPTDYSNSPNVQGQPYGSNRGNVPSYSNGNLNYNSNTPGGAYQGGNVGGASGGVTDRHGGGVPNNNGSPIDGTSGSRYGPYNSGGTGVQDNEYSGGPQNYIDPNSIDGDDSEAEASVAQSINGTVASASSKGGNDKGRAQTNVHGTYTGSGSFQAQAQITGDNKQAQSEVSGGQKGASSTASGSGRNNKSQANVQLGSETGSVQTQSQSAGVMHSSNSQVQGSVKGGMADAQAKGPGSTSSQAQIGFTPYKDKDKSSHDLQKTPFVGGGVASAQSSGRTGQSQSQLHGTFKYGITYNGAAQSGASLDKDAVFPNRLSFEKIDVFDENEKNINVDMTETPQSLNPDIEPHVEPSSTYEPYNFENETDVTTIKNAVDETIINSEGSHTHLDHHKTDDSYLSGPTLSGTKKSFSTNHINNPGTDYEFSTVKDELPPESDYDTDEPFNSDGSEESDLAQGEYSNYDEFTRESPTHQSLLSSNRKPLEVRQSTGGNTQHIVLGSLQNHNAEIIQKNSDVPDENKVYLAGERIPGTGGYTVPAGFTGSVKSVASKDNTYVVGYRDSPSQAQTVTLTPGTGKVKYMYPPAYGKHVMPKNLRSLYSPKDDNKYLSVSKSVTRALDSENNIRKQYSHTYYTKSSSCGYFTFTCTMVSSAEGRKKVCKPKIPTNSDGTQIRC